MQTLIDPYGGELIDLVVTSDEREQFLAETSSLPSLQLSERAVCDLELLANGGFSPLDGFMAKADFNNVLAEMRLADGTVFPMPVTLPVDRFDGLALGKKIVLRDAHNDLLGVMTVEEIYEWSKPKFAKQVLGTEDVRHPLVTEMQHWGKFNIAGKLPGCHVTLHK